jgi:intracellular sulfur oxidation DsrE/DsrF family protein
MNSIPRQLATAIACAAFALPLSAIAADEPKKAVAVQKKKPAAKAPQKERVIIQVSDADPQKWNLALNNAKNVQADLGADKTEIEIVAYGPGIGMLKADALVANRIEEAVASGVKVVACENTMRNLKISRDDMHKNIEYVGAGVVELMRKQQLGYAYVRP